MSLVSRVKQERIYKKEVQGITFEIEIPRMDFVARNVETDLNGFDLLNRQIIGWSGANEKHFLDDGDEKTEVPFDLALLEEYLGDRPLIVQELYQDLIQKTMERSEKINSMGKRS